ncbi:hypothetical protein HY933_03630 [Candidatus Falkowbacteria bacterium]|nr:hypothetical protein [Candidatus Falkowbacteria bacterium]
MIDAPQTGTDIPVSSQRPISSYATSRFPWLTMIISILATVIVVGGGGYYWWQQSVGTTQVTLQQQADAAAASVTACANDLTGCRDQLTKSQDEQQQINAELAMIAQLPYQGWKTYTDTQFGWQWLYPPDWQVSEQVINAAKNVSGKNGFCLKFDSSDSTTLSVCYRLQSDTTATTWFRTGIGYTELAKVPVSFSILGQQMNEKTLFGQDGEVKDIIYFQNMKDDETGYPARAKVGDYYITAMASDAGFRGTGLSVIDQKLLDLILASAKLPTAVEQP